MLEYLLIIAAIVLPLIAAIVLPLIVARCIGDMGLEDEADHDVWRQGYSTFGMDEKAGRRCGPRRLENLWRSDEHE